MVEYHILTPKWPSYELIDFGEGWRWERWGEVTVARPDSWAIGRPQRKRDLWTARHIYHPTGPYQGQWEPPLPEKWPLLYQGKGWRMQLWCRAGKFKHLGIFPEQAVHWEWLYAKLKRWSHPQILNLFAYTGAASVAAALAGAKVTHIDASRSAISWAAENAALNNISTIRWIVEDVRKFVQRARRRGEKYDAILLDPPPYGIGSGGQRWEIQRDLPPLLENLLPLLREERGLLLLNLYSADFSPYTLWRLIQEVRPIPLEIGELTLATQQGRHLSTGIFLRGDW
ncbi:MAG: class I SAM-dependent methyltransferase [Bacteroidia bacterium]|nr:class I SAM-dependent methyltransferase [Bacteroidia bacterium]MCX7763971.1 class I SAM-dependent methyltransferase [Bacteroidia bacterium]MDW8058235.1 class I SAM-dependent methyltransferase [Bacteroidia bacterium]